MPGERRRGAATATVGAAGLVAGGLLRHGAARRVIALTGKNPKVHWYGVPKHGDKLARHMFVGGSALGAVSTVPFAVGTANAVRPHQVGKRDSFVREGVYGTHDALKEKVDSIRTPVPLKIRATQIGVGAGAGLTASALARVALKGRAKALRPVVGPLAGATGALASLPLGNHLVQRQNSGYVVTPAGVKRAKKPIVRGKRSEAPVTHRSFRSDVGKRDTYLGAKTPYYQQRAQVTTAGSVPVVGPALQARQSARYAPPGQKAKAATRQLAFGAGAGLAAGFAGAHGAAALADRTPLGRKAEAGVGRMEAHPIGRHLIPKVPQSSHPLLEPLTRSKGRTAAAALGFLGTRAVVTGVGNQRAITANQGDQERYNRRHHITKAANLAKAQTLVAAPAPKEAHRLARRKRLSATLSTVGGVAGLSALGLLAAKRPAAATKVSIIGSGIGGTNALLGAKIQRKEAKVIDPKTRGANLAKAMPFLHPRATPFTAGAGLQRHMAGLGGSVTNQVRGVRSAPLGPAAPPKVTRGLSGNDFGETVGRLGRALRRQDKEFSATVHPISGRILDMRRGDASSGAIGGLSTRFHRESTMRMAALADKTSNPVVRGRAEATLSRTNPMTSGPSLVHLHNHPELHSGAFRPAPSAQDTQALRGMGNDRLGVLSHRPAPRGQAQTKLVLSRNYASPTADIPTAERRFETQDRATVPKEFLPKIFPYRDAPGAADFRHLRRKAMKNAAKTSDGRITDYSSYFRAKTGSRKAAEQTGLYSRTTLHKAALPTHAVHRSFGKVRVLSQHSKDHFMVLTNRDEKRLLHRDTLTFTNRVSKAVRVRRLNGRQGKWSADEVREAWGQAQQLRRKVSQRELGEAMGLGQSGMSMHLSGKNGGKGVGTHNDMATMRREGVWHPRKTNGLTYEQAHQQRFGKAGGADKRALAFLGGGGMKARRTATIRHPSGREVQIDRVRVSPIHALRQEMGQNTASPLARTVLAEHGKDTLKMRSANHPSVNGDPRGRRVPGPGIRRDWGPRDENLAKRDEWKRQAPLKTSVSPDDARKLVARHGLTGPLPKNLDREQKRAAYEARYVTAGGHKAEHWQRRAVRADKVKTAGVAGATASGAAWLGSRGKAGPAVVRHLARRGLAPRHLPSAHQVQRTAETAAAASATVGGAAELYAGHARRKRSSYASAPAGVASSALRRMQSYDRSSS